MNLTAGLEKPTFVFPNRLIKLHYSKHAKERLIERTTGSLILAPEYVRPSWDNTIERKIINGKVEQATVVLDYKKGVKMYLPIVLDCGLVKTVYFRNVEKRKHTIKKEFHAQEDYRAKTNREALEETSNPKDTRTEAAGEGGFGENVENVSGDMGRKENRWRKLLRIIWDSYIWGAKNTVF